MPADLGHHAARLPLKRYFGVWPYRPLLVGVLGFAMVWASISYADPIWNAAAPLRQVATSVGISAVTGIAFAVVLWLARRFSAGRRVHYPEYFIMSVLSAFVANMARISLGQTPAGGTVYIGHAIWTGTVRMGAMVLLAQAIAGIAHWRLEQQVSRTQAALDESREQQQMMLEADEAVRRQVSEVLHDGVQAGLVASCLELRLAVDSLQPADRSAIVAVITRLEQIRALDVRGAARALSPSLESQDLDHCLNELGRRYAPGMAVAISVEPLLQQRLLRDDPYALLACYRIVEQGLLNAATHGRARICTVTIDADTVTNVMIRVQDDGVGLAHEQQQQGLGSAVITTWTRLFDGEWSLVPAPGQGCLLIARLSLDPGT